MTPSHKREIVCYFVGQGAEATFRIRDGRRFEMAKIALAKFAAPNYRDGERRSGDIQIIRDQDRAEFDRIIRGVTK